MTPHELSPGDVVILHCEQARCQVTARPNFKTAEAPHK